MAGGVLSVVGFLASVALALAALEPADRPAAAPDLSKVGRGVIGGGCVEEPTKAPPPVFGGGHPERSFYSPGERPSDQDLRHVLGDGLIVVSYRPSLSDEEKLALAEWSRIGGVLVVPAQAGRPSAFRAANARRTISCRLLDLDELDRVPGTRIAVRIRESTQ